MGLFTTTLALGAGYYAGMKLGDRPVRAVRDAKDQMRGRAEAVGTQASDLRTRASEAARAVRSRLAVGDATLDVRAVREVMSAAQRDERARFWMESELRRRPKRSTSRRPSVRPPRR